MSLSINLHREWERLKKAFKQNVTVSNSYVVDLASLGITYLLVIVALVLF